LRRSDMRSVSALATGFRSERVIPGKAALVGIDALPALASGLGGQFRVLRKAALFVGNALPALARDQLLLFRIHRGKAAVGFTWLLACHHRFSPCAPTPLLVEQRAWLDA